MDPKGREAVITVEDTGVGIPPEEIDRVFDPFFTTKEIGAGTGLGLSIVYGIIEKHNGSIAVESKEGEGTRFIIRLPFQPFSQEKRLSP
jgi:signal transduction histidine kinase